LRPRGAELHRLGYTRALQREFRCTSINRVCSESPTRKGLRPPTQQQASRRRRASRHAGCPRRRGDAAGQAWPDFIGPPTAVAKGGAGRPASHHRNETTPNLTMVKAVDGSKW
jgi:hypothetical protein